MMQTDVKSAHLNNSGFAVLGPNRLKGLATVGTATAGTLDIFDTVTESKTELPQWVNIIDYNVSETHNKASTVINIKAV